MDFEHFIAVDWSGARSGGNICLAECFSGSTVPHLVPCPAARWRRASLFGWLESLSEESGRRVLVGFDFAFAFPYCDEEAYFPSHPDSPPGLPGLWRLVDSVCGQSPDFYGGAFYTSQEAPFADYLCAQHYTGKCFRARLRLTEAACRRQATPPTSVYKCVGPDQVGSGSIAGMRFLHRLAGKRRGSLSVWPFQMVAGSRVTIVEIFPRLFFLLAGGRPRRTGAPDTVNRALVYYGSEPLDAGAEELTEHKSDALVSAAALRHLSQDESIWNPKGMTKCARRYEGWIFGVR